MVLFQFGVKIAEAVAARDFLKRKKVHATSFYALTPHTLVAGYIFSHLSRQYEFLIVAKVWSPGIICF